MKICFIVPYIGEWPWWMPHYLRSCAFNKDIDWLLIGDVEPQCALPANVSFVRLDLAGINALASSKLGRKVDIQKPYKLCDLRPAFGKVFEEHLGGYDFWGHTDIDILYGDLMGLIPDSALRDYDIITPYNTSCGHFQLYRNVEHVNRLYLQVDNLDAMLLGDKYQLYDHVKFAPVLKAAKWFTRDYYAELKKERCFLGANIKGGGNIFYEDRTGDEVYSWESGHACQLKEGVKREFLYLHFMEWKNAAVWNAAGLRFKVTSERSRGVALAEQGSHGGQKAGDPASSLRARDFAAVSATLRDGGECLVLSGDGIREIGAGQLRRLEIRNKWSGLLAPLKRLGRRGFSLLLGPVNLLKRLDEFRNRKGIKLFFHRLLPRIKTAKKSLIKRRRLGWVNSFRLMLLERGKLSYNLSLHLPGYESKLTVRRDSTDLKVLDHIFVNGAYDIKLPFEPALIVDCGANVGYATVFFRARFPQTKIVAIEPDSQNWEAMQENLRGILNVEIQNAGIWWRRGRLAVEASGYQHSGAWDQVTLEDSDGAVKAITMDELIGEAHKENVLVKMDIEGAEKEVFENGSLKWLDAVDGLIIELHDGYKAGCSEAFYNAMRGRQFEISAKGENIICVRQGFLK